MNDAEFLLDYWGRYKKILFNPDIDNKLIQAAKIIQSLKGTSKKVLLFGNGASASLASHGATDLTKQANIRSQVFHDHNLLTAFANDYGYEHWVTKTIEFYANQGDIIIFISVSGTSPNLVNALSAFKDNFKFISLTGCDESNPLNSESDIGLWVDSRAYNIVESVHTIYLTTIIDLIIGKAEYSVS